VYDGLFLTEGAYSHVYQIWTSKGNLIIIYFTAKLAMLTCKR